MGKKESNAILINYKINSSNTEDVVWRPSDSSCQTNIFNQLEIINPAEFGQEIFHSNVIDTTVDTTIESSDTDLPKKQD